MALVFQSMPDKFNLEDQLRPGEDDSWAATRFRRLMVPGRLALFVMGGDAEQAGLYGWGRITAEPSRDYDGSYRVAVKYKGKFPRPLSRSFFRRDPTLRKTLLVRVPQGTNFEFTPDELRAVLGGLKESGLSDGEFTKAVEQEIRELPSKASAMGAVI